MRSMSNYFKIIVLFFLFIPVAHSQNDSIKHVIKKGENVYRISLRYNVSMTEIFNLNPGSKELIKAGEILYIPQKTSKAPQKPTKNSQGYLVSKGETKYGISKSFNISITELENANPFIKNGLQAGHILKIPQKNNSTEAINSNTNQHIVQKGETLWGISNKYGIPLENLISLNKNQLGQFLQIGQVLEISKPTNNKQNSTSYLVKKGDTKYGLSKQFGISISELERLNPQIKNVLKEGSLLKLEESVIEKAETIVLNDSKDEQEQESLDDLHIIKPKETIYSISKNAGISKEELIALNPKLKTAVLAGDTIRLSKNGKQTILNNSKKIEQFDQFNAELYWVDSSIEKNATTIKNKNDYLLGLRYAMNKAKSKFPNMALEFKNTNSSDDLISESNEDNSIRFKIKPNPQFENDRISQLSSYVVSETKNNSDNTILIKALPSEAEMQRKVIQYLKHKDENVICLFDDDHIENSKTVKERLPNSKLIKINNKNSFKSKELEKSLKKEALNFVVIESSKVGVFLSATSLLLKKSSSYNIQLVVLNHKNIPDSTKISYNRFKILNLTYPMPFNPNSLREHSSSYNVAYLVGSEILNRLNTKGIEAFKDNNPTSFLGTVFRYDFKENTAENKAVSIYMFNDDSNSYLISTY